MPSQVIINDISPYTQIMATNAGQVLFSTDWTANAASDVVVYLTPVGDEPDDLTQKLNSSQFNVAFIGSQNIVEVTLIVGAAVGDIITIIRDTPADRVNLYTNTNFTPSMLNQDFGILTLVDQQAQLVNQQVAPRYNYSAVITPVVDTILPLLNQNQIWIMNDTRTEIIAADIADLTTGITEIDTGLGLTGGPITTTGTISFAPMDPGTIWANPSAFTAPPVMVPISSFGLTNPALISIGSLTTVANQMLVTTAPNTYAVIGPANSSTLITSAIGVPSFSTSLPTLVQSNILQLGAQILALNMNGHQINNVTDPTNAQDAATKNYVDGQTGVFLPLIGGTMQGVINMNNHKITNLTDPTLGQDAVTLSFLNTTVGSFLPLSGGTMSGAINMGSHKITNLLDPTNPQDAATKNYVDLVAVGLAVQGACFATTTANLTATYANGASGIGATLINAGTLVTFSTDGTTPPTNSRILVKNQTTTLQNGIYVLTNVGSGAVAWILTRAADYDQPSEIQPGDLVVINNGTLFAGTSFIETASVSAIGTDPILFSQFTFSATAVLLKANNLSDVANTATSFANISPTPGTSGNVLTSNGTNWISSPSTGSGTVSSGLINQLARYATSGTTVSGLPTLSSAGLLTDVSGVPGWVASTGTGAPVLGTAPTITSPKINSINDQTNNLPVTTFVSVPAAVNTIGFLSNATGGAPFVTFSGTDTNVGAIFNTKGTGSFIFTNGLGGSSANYLSLNGIANSVNNYFSMTNSGTGLNPVLSVTGSDTNISMTINSRGTGGVNIKGRIDGSSVPAGYVGEVITASNTTGVVQSVSATPTNITSITITPGNWLILGNAETQAGNTQSQANFWTSTTSATFPGFVGGFSVATASSSIFGQIGGATPPKILNVTVSTIVYLSFDCFFASSTVTGYGTITAIRIA